MSHVPSPLCRLVLTLSVIAGSARADDYPQWLGPNRDGVWREQGVLESFPEGEPKVRWRVPVAGGYSGPAVAAGKVVVTDFVMKPGQSRPNDPFAKVSLPGTERILCLDESTGNRLWKVEYDAPYALSYAAGPRCTPTIDVAAGRVYTLGAEGHLYCIGLDDGQVIWNKKLEGDTPVWGFAGHPVI
jgi:outer membrane protein assembly factor BamB